MYARAGAGGGAFRGFCSPCSRLNSRISSAVMVPQLQSHNDCSAGSSSPREGSRTGSTPTGCACMPGGEGHGKIACTLLPSPESPRAHSAVMVPQLQSHTDCSAGSCTHSARRSDSATAAAVKHTTAVLVLTPPRARALAAHPHKGRACMLAGEAHGVSRSMNHPCKRGM